MKQVIFIFLIGLVILGGCSTMSKDEVVKDGDVVKVHYTGSLDNGSVFDSSEGRDPLEFTVGAHQVIPGFENGVIGMNVGETKKIHIPVEDAYGPVRPELTQELPRSIVPDDVKLEVGKELILSARGQPIPVKVKSFDDENIVFDMNHPLAGQALNFELTLVAIGNESSE